MSEIVLVLTEAEAKHTLEALKERCWRLEEAGKGTQIAIPTMERVWEKLNNLGVE